MKIYVVVDTNVLVSALLSKHEDAATVQVLNRLLEMMLVSFTVMTLQKSMKKF